MLRRRCVFLQVVGHGNVQQGIVLCLLPPAVVGTGIGEGDDTRKPCSFQQLLLSLHWTMRIALPEPSVHKE